jgi:tetratricopeptide (TPR) repeat protein
MQKIDQAQFLFDADIYNIARIDLALFELDKIIADSTLNQEEATAKFSQVLQSITALSQQVIAYDIKSYSNYLYILNVYKSLASVGVKDAAPQAIQIIDQISTFVPYNPTLSLQKAQVYVVLKDFDKAVEFAQEALELKPNYVQAAFLLSQIQAEKGEINEAIASIKSIIVQNPLEPTLYFQLGLLQYNQSKYSEAILSLGDALTLSPEFNNAKYFLGLSYYKNNQTDRAILIFESLAQSLPNNQEVKKVLSNMNSGVDALSGIQTEAVEETLPVEEDVVEGDE